MIETVCGVYKSIESNSSNPSQNKTNAHQKVCRILGGDERDLWHYSVVFVDPKTSNAPPEHCISSFKSPQSKTKAHQMVCFCFGGVRGIWTLARLLTAYSLSRGAPSASWVSLRINKLFNWLRKYSSILYLLCQVQKQLIEEKKYPYSWQLKSKMISFSTHGEMSERFKEPVLKTGDGATHRGFESHSIRQRTRPSLGMVLFFIERWRFEKMNLLTGADAGVICLQKRSQKKYLNYFKKGVDKIRIPC